LPLDLLDSAEQDIKQHFQKSNEFIENCLRKDGKVLVHCHAGISRSSTIILAYLIKHQNMSFEDALAHAQTKRTKINPNPGFRKQLKEFEKSLNQKTNG
jgi:protein-tyrosine phosphatase